MPPKSKRKRSLEAAAERAREARKAKLEAEAVPEPDELLSTSPQPSTSVSEPIIMDEDSNLDPSFDPDKELAANPKLKLEQYIEEWVLSLDREDKISLGLFVSFHLEHLLNFTKTNAADYSGIMIGKSERTIRQWQTDFLEAGEIPDNKQGRYKRTGILWSSEKLNEKASAYVREHASVKGEANLTSITFCEWVNEDLLPNSNLEPGFPRKVSIDLAQRWLHRMGFEVLSPKKGMYIDGHEREDEVKERGIFLKKMAELGFVHPDNAPTPESARAYPCDVPLPSTETRDKTVFFFHDESTFNSNEDQHFQWGQKGEHMLRPKSKGSGIMVSDFIDERKGYLALTEEEHRKAVKNDSSIKQQARLLLEYGENREGYFTSEKFMAQVDIAVKIAEVKYPRSDNWKYVWIFDQSSCHKAMADDALDASKMNVKPGGMQPKMRTTMWAGKEQKMCYDNGTPKGMRAVLEERGINTETLIGPQMQVILSNHEDFKSEKPKVIHFLENKGHMALFLPKFHPEMNPIERVWAQSKRYTKAFCNYTLPSLRKTIPLGLDYVTLDNIVKFHRKARDYMFAYFEGHVAGPKLEAQVKSYKSHRRVGRHD